MKSPNYTCRIDPELKAQSTALLDNLGVSLGTAINIFLRKLVSVGGFPFDVRVEKDVRKSSIPNRETVEALLEAERIADDPNVPAYDVEDALKLLKA